MNILAIIDWYPFDGAERLARYADVGCVDVVARGASSTRLQFTLF